MVRKLELHESAMFSFHRRPCWLGTTGPKMGSSGPPAWPSAQPAAGWNGGTFFDRWRFFEHCPECDNCPDVPLPVILKLFLPYLNAPPLASALLVFLPCTTLRPRRSNAAKTSHTDGTRRQGHGTGPFHWQPVSTNLSLARLRTARTAFMGMHQRWKQPTPGALGMKQQCRIATNISQWTSINRSWRSTTSE